MPMLVKKPTRNSWIFDICGSVKAHSSSHLLKVHSAKKWKKKQHLDVSRDSLFERSRAVAAPTPTLLRLSDMRLHPNEMKVGGPRCHEKNVKISATCTANDDDSFPYKTHVACHRDHHVIMVTDATANGNTHFLSSWGVASGEKARRTHKLPRL